MKLLCVSSDRSQLVWLLKRLLCCRIPCAVCKGETDAELSVWIQQDLDFPLALKIFADRDRELHIPQQESSIKLPAPLAEERCSGPDIAAVIATGQCAAMAA
jgi:hypothetical protein